MRAVAKTIKTYLEGFGLPAYSLRSVPKDVNPPYLVFPVNLPEWNQKATFYIQGWYRTTSNEELFTKADEIIADIGVGKTIPMPGGYLVIYPESPLVQLDVDGDYRYFYINLSINAYQMPGAFPEEGVVNAET